jgi:hypothetical protein
MYSVIHKNSAVSSRWTAVLTLIVMLANKKKNKNRIKFSSPNVKIYILKR